ncbi:hypothetical protein SS50377_20499 [Spironucleus salmonicida]|uniref:Uncharacterized protein n=1 Tax=Spironucleus salmonicida TaxID=348837 RepID=A0A9P8LZG1_9EUKA|nr:hypothetical protein SS50377_20499 [Spironucleus salmonicida]
MCCSSLKSFKQSYDQLLVLKQENSFKNICPINTTTKIILISTIQLGFAYSIQIFYELQSEFSTICRIAAFYQNLVLEKVKISQKSAFSTANKCIFRAFTPLCIKQNLSNSLTFPFHFIPFHFTPYSKNSKNSKKLLAQILAFLCYTH